MAIADRHDGMLVIDEAHATGVSGRTGAGSAPTSKAATNVVTLHTCGKALGVMGALVLAPARAARLSRQPLPALHLRDRALAADGGAGARRARSSAASRPQRRERLQRARRLRRPPARSRAAASRRRGSQILPVIVGADERAVTLAAAHAGARLRHPRHAPADRAGGHRAPAHVAHAQRRRGGVSRRMVGGARRGAGEALGPA